jgi:hypothetical protein
VPKAQEARARDALEDLITAYRGDGRGRAGKHANPEWMDDAQKVLTSLGGSQNVRGDTPGSRASRSEGGGTTPTDTQAAARDLMNE